MIHPVLDRIIFFLLLVLFPLYVTAQENEEKRNSSRYDVSIGFAGTGGISNARAREGNITWEQGIAAGGGIIGEKMFNNYFGIHSGLWYIDTRFSFEMNGQKLDIKGKSLHMPVFLITSANLGFFSINFLTGLAVTQFLKIDISSGDAASDVLDFVEYRELGAGGGLNFKFRIGHFTDFFIGATAHYCITDLLRDPNKDSANYYDARGMTGFLFRTDLFPR